MNGRNGLYWLAGVVFALTLTAIVILRLAGQPVNDVVTLAGPILTGVFIVGVLGKQLDETKAKVETVERQTNGMLDERFRTHATAAAETAAATALDKAGVTAGGGASE